MTIKQSVINTFNRVGIDYINFDNENKEIPIANRFTGEEINTTRLITECIQWVYDTSDQYERNIMDVKISDFDRVRYFVLDQDHEAYMICLD